MSARPSTALPIVAALTIVAGGAALLFPGQEPASGTGGPEEGLEGAFSLPDIGPAPSAPARVIEAPTLVAVAPGGGALGCPGQHSPPDVSPFEALNLRQQELWDRLRHTMRQGTGSESLREGITEVFRQGGDREEGVRLLLSASDRRDGEFDHAMAAMLVLGMRAIAAEDYATAAGWAEGAAEAAPTDPAPALLTWLSARHRGDTHAVHAALARAHELDPEEPGVALSYGRELARTGDPETAIRVLDAYLAVDPEAGFVVELRRREATRARLLADHAEDLRSGVRVRYPQGIEGADAAALHHAILRALDDAAALLGGERVAKLVVNVYAHRSDMLEASCGPSWSGALYDGVLHLPAQLLTMDRAAERVVRHESLHVALHHAAPRSPVWLHEAVAQHFAGDRGSQHERSYRFMTDNRTFISFASLEGSFSDITDPDDARLAYHQSLAMLELLLEREGPEAIRRAVRHLAQDGEPAGVLSAMSPDPLTGDELLAYVGR